MQGTDQDKEGLEFSCQQTLLKDQKSPILPQSSSENGRLNAWKVNITADSRGSSRQLRLAMIPNETPPSETCPDMDLTLASASGLPNALRGI